MTNYLFSLDIDGIQNYIFKTNRLKSIAGASSILDRINTKQTIKRLKNNYGFGADPKSDDRFIYSNGGCSKIVFKNKNDAEKFSSVIQNDYHKYGISVTTAITKIDSDEKLAYENAETHVAHQKYNTNKITKPATNPFLKICDFCGREYASSNKNIDKKKRYLCSTCSSKEDEPIREFRLLENISFEQNLENIANGIDSNLVALVVMDGNQMGKKISNLPTNNFFKHLKNFSHQVDIIIHEKVKSLIISHPEYVHQKPIEFIRPVIIGGDDLCYIVRAKYGLSFTCELIQEIKKASSNNEERENENIFGAGIEICAGIVFMKYNAPFHAAYRLAKSLLASAKRKSIMGSGEAMVDFHIAYSDSGDSIESLRKKAYTYEDELGHNCLLTRKPYPVSWLVSGTHLGFHARLNTLKTLLEGRNKLKDLRNIVRLGRNGSIFSLLQISKKMNPSDKKLFLENYILNDKLWELNNGYLTTDLLDLVELMDIIY